jgi:hypothetical protein
LPVASIDQRACRIPDLTPQIARELYAALERLGADAELLAIVGSWRDTLDDGEVLSMLREYNATGRALHRPQWLPAGDRQGSRNRPGERLLSANVAKMLSRVYHAPAGPTQWSAAALSRACPGTSSQDQRSHGSVRRPHTSRLLHCRLARFGNARRRCSRGTPLQFRNKRMTVLTLSSPDQLGGALLTATCRSRSRLRRDAPFWPAFVTVEPSRPRCNCDGQGRRATFCSTSPSDRGHARC